MTTTITRRSDGDEHLSPGQVARRLNVSRTTVYRWITGGHLPAYALPSGHYRVRADDLRGFLGAFNIPNPDEVKPEAAPPTLSAAGAGDAEGELAVLIADDQPDVQRYLRAIVEHAAPGARIVCAGNGVEACVAVGSFRPRLLLLDIIMPGMDGFAVLEELLRRPEMQGCSVIVVSGCDPFDRVEALPATYPQVIACLRKPVPVPALVSAIRQAAAPAVR